MHLVPLITKDIINIKVKLAELSNAQIWDDSF